MNRWSRSGLSLPRDTTTTAHLAAVYNNFDFSGPLGFAKRAAELSDRVMEQK